MGNGTPIRNVGGQFLLLLIAQILSALLQALALILVARWVAPSEFGQFAATLALLSTVVTMGDLGLSTLATRLRAVDASSPGLHRALTAAQQFSAIAGVFGLGASFLLFGGPGQSLDLVLVAAYVVVDRCMQIYLGVAIADGHTHINVVVLAVGRGGLLLGTWLLVTQIGLGPETAYGAAGAVMSLVGYLLARRLMGQIREPKRGASMRSLLGDARPFWIASGSQLVRTLDVSIVAVVASVASAGLYAVPSRLTAPLRLLPTTLNRMTIPYASRGDRAVIANLRKVMLGVLLFMTVAFAVIFAFAPEILRVTVGPQYVGATWPLRILIVGVLINVAGSFKSGILQGSGDQVYVAKMGVFLAMIFIGMVALLAFLFGAVGAAVAATATYVVQFVLVTARRIPERHEVS